MFDLKQIRCFVAVGEELHFKRAAKRMFMSQPPLSRQIRLLEHELNTQLFIRTSRSVKLTPAGSAFLKDARRLLALADNAAQQAQRISRGESGFLRLGFTAGSSYSFLPNLLAQLKRSIQDVDIELHEMVTQQQIEALHHGDIDVGLLRSPVEGDGFERLCVAREPMMLAVPRGHPLAKSRTPALVDLAGHPFITFHPADGSYFYDLIDRSFKNELIPTSYVQRVSQIHSILALVAAGQGIALVPASSKALHFAGTIIRKIKTPPMFAELHLAWRADNTNPVLPRLKKIAQKYFEM